jgi:hypothetical protein
MGFRSDATRSSELLIEQHLDKSLLRLVEGDHSHGELATGIVGEVRDNLAHHRIGFGPIGATRTAIIDSGHYDKPHRHVLRYR